MSEDFLNFLNGSEDEELIEAQVEKIGTSIDAPKASPKIFFDDPKVVGDDYPADFLKLVECITRYQSILLKVDIEALLNELGGISYSVPSTPTIQLLNSELQKIQALKERVSEIVKVLIPSHTMKKRHLDLLKDTWMRYSKEGSVDKRKADANYRFHEFEAEYGGIDALYKEAMHVMKNLESHQEILSRRITIVGHQLKLMDLRRNGLPDFDFHGEALRENDALDNEDGSFLGNSSVI